jgi:hypothetical protein
MNSWDGMSDIEHYEAFLAARPVRGLRWSRACQLFGTIRWGSPPRKRNRPRLLPKEFRSLLLQIDNAARAHGAGLLLIVWGFRSQALPDSSSAESSLQQELYQFGIDHRVPVVDLLPLFRDLCQKHAPDKIFLDFVHTTSLTNAEIGRRVATEIERWYRAR